METQSIFKGYHLAVTISWNLLAGWLAGRRFLVLIIKVTLSELSEASAPSSFQKRLIHFIEIRRMPKNIFCALHDPTCTSEIECKVSPAFKIQSIQSIRQKGRQATGEKRQAANNHNPKAKPEQSEKSKTTTSRDYAVTISRLQ